jgi:GDP-L-fucose synthase
VSLFAAARAAGTRTVLTLLSTCIFPDPPPALPLTDGMLHAGPPHASNAPYAHAKRLAAVLGAAHEAEAPPELGGTRFVFVTPTNVYGPRDNFNVSAGHVLPALVAKAAAAAAAGGDLLVLGSGTPLRQFLYAPDLARLLLWAAREYDDAPPLILAPEEEMTVADAARLVAAATPGLGAHRVAFDASRADGQHRKTASNALLRARLPGFVFTPLAAGVADTVAWFAAHKGDAGTRT